MAHDGPKSSYELAMERLRQKDKEASVEDRPLTEEQKAAIAEARQFYTAKVAELDILHQSGLAGAASAEEIERLNDNLRRDKERLAGDRDRKIDDALFLLAFLSFGLVEVELVGAQPRSNGEIGDGVRAHGAAGQIGHYHCVSP